MTTHALTEIKRGDAVTGYKCACGTFNPAGDLIAQSYQVLAHADQVIDAPDEAKYYRDLWATNPPQVSEYGRWDDMGTYYEETTL